MKKAAIIILSILAYGCVRLMRTRTRRPTPQASIDNKQKIRVEYKRIPEDCVRVVEDKKRTHINFSTVAGRKLYENGYNYYRLYKIMDNNLLVGEEKVYIGLTKSQESYYRKVHIRFMPHSFIYNLVGVHHKELLEKFYGEGIPNRALLKITGYKSNPENGHLDLRIKLFRRCDEKEPFVYQDSTCEYANPRREGRARVSSGYLICWCFGGRHSNIYFPLEDGRQLDKAGYEWWKLSTKRDKTDPRNIKVYILLAKEPASKQGYLPIHRTSKKNKDGDVVTAMFALTHNDPVGRIGTVWGKIIEHKQLLKIMDWGIDDRQILSLEIAPV